MNTKTEDVGIELASFNPLVHVPGLWRCAKCGFVLVQSNLNASDGTVTARDDAGDRCPNDNAPLWRVSWKDHATEMGDRCEKEVTENARLRSSHDALVKALEEAKLFIEASGPDDDPEWRADVGGLITRIAAALSRSKAQGGE